MRTLLVPVVHFAGSIVCISCSLTTSLFTSVGTVVFDVSGHASSGGSHKDATTIGVEFLQRPRVMSSPRI